MAKALRLPAVLEETGLGKTTVYTQIRDGKFPPGTKRTDVRVHTWDADEIAAWKSGMWKPAEDAA